jgi:hypothetical protein
VAGKGSWRDAHSLQEKESANNPIALPRCLISLNRS